MEKGILHQAVCGRYAVIDGSCPMIRYKTPCICNETHSPLYLPFWSKVIKLLFII